jgi:hypothetical protein
MTWTDAHVWRIFIRRSRQNCASPEKVQGSPAISDRAFNIFGSEEQIAKHGLDATE